MPPTPARAAQAALDEQGFVVIAARPGLAIGSVIRGDAVTGNGPVPGPFVIVGIAEFQDFDRQSQMHFGCPPAPDFEVESYTYYKVVAE